MNRRKIPLSAYRALSVHELTVPKVCTISFWAHKNPVREVPVGMPFHRGGN